MSSNAEAKSSPLNVLKWILVVALVAAGVVGNQYFADESLLYRVLGLVAIGIVAVMIALATTQGAAFATLVKQASIVLAVVLIAALILWGLDSLLGWIASLIIG